MPKTDEILGQMRVSPASIRFSDLCRVCDRFFGNARQEGTSHRIYKTPWQGDPRVNVQNSKGMAKAYQVRQILKAIKRLSDEKND